MDHVFSSIRQKVVVGRFQVMETAAPWKPWKTNYMFSTVPTAVGKLGQLRSSFPQFPQPLRLDIVLKEKKKQRLREGLSKIEWTRCSQKRKNLSSRPLSIGRF